jgi:hypothetical protein
VAPAAVFPFQSRVAAGSDPHPEKLEYITYFEIQAMSLVAPVAGLRKAHMVNVYVGF